MLHFPKDSQGSGTQKPNKMSLARESRQEESKSIGIQILVNYGKRGARWSRRRKRSLTVVNALAYSWAGFWIELSRMHPKTTLFAPGEGGGSVLFDYSK